MTKWLRRFSYFLLGLIVLLHAVPYVFSVSSPDEYEPETPFTESQYETIEGVLIHYRLWAPDPLQPRGKVLLVHGLAGSTFSWRHNVEALRQAGFLVVAADLPGFGYSDRQLGMDHSQQTRSIQLWQLLDTVDRDLQEPLQSEGWFLVGHSMGGGTAAAMALERQQQSSGLVLVAGALSENNNRSAGEFFLAYPPLQRWIQVVMEEIAFQPERIRGFLASAYGRTPTDDELTGYLLPLLQPGTPLTLIDLISTAENEPLSSMKSLQIPVMGLWGESDSWVPREEGEKLLDVIPNMKLTIIPEAAHCPMETHPDLFNEELIAFLEQ
jgi:pimeloyl-ACP methyl ester carboxylesterase